MLGSWGIGLILCRLQGLVPYGALVVLSAGMVGSTIGAVTMGRKPQVSIALFTAGLLSVAALSFWWFGGYLLPLLTSGVYLLTAGALTVTGYGFYGPLGVWSTVLLSLSVFAAGDYGGFWGISAGIAALFALLLTLDGFRDSSIRKSQHKKREHRVVDDPGHLQRHSYLLTGLFLILSLSVGLLTLGLSSGLVQAVRSAFSEGTAGAAGIFKWIFWLIEAFLQWFSDLFPDIEDKNPTYQPDNSREAPIYTGGEGSWLSTVIMIICFVLACLGLSIVLGRMLFKARRQNRHAQDISDFEDELESLTRPGFRLRWKRKRTRQRYREFSDPALQIRYVFQQLLRKRQKEDGTVLTKTPNEVLNPQVTDEAVLVAAYNRVKYAEGSVSPQELAAAERYLKKL